MTRAWLYCNIAVQGQSHPPTHPLQLPACSHLHPCAKAVSRHRNGCRSNSASIRARPSTKPITSQTVTNELPSSFIFIQFYVYFMVVLGFGDVVTAALSFGGVRVGRGLLGWFICHARPLCLSLLFLQVSIRLHTCHIPLPYQSHAWFTRSD